MVSAAFVVFSESDGGFQTIPRCILEGLKGIEWVFRSVLEFQVWESFRDVCGVARDVARGFWRSLREFR